MIKKLVVAGVIVLVAGAVLAFVTGVGPVPGAESGDDIESFPTETAGSGATQPTNQGTEASSAPYTMTVDSIEECGNTCRDVTTTLTNEQSTAASDVTVYTRIYAGNGTDGEVVWEGTEAVGDIGAGESYTATKRVELSLTNGYAVERHDGWITIQTSIQSADGTVTFTERRDVA